MKTVKEKENVNAVKEKEYVNANAWGEICKYNPRTDIVQVVDGLAVDIDDMLRTGIVKEGSDNLDSNGIDSPDKIVGRIRDVFDAMDAARAVKKYGKKAPAKAEAAIENAPSNE